VGKFAAFINVQKPKVFQLQGASPPPLTKSSAPESRCGPPQTPVMGPPSCIWGPPTPAPVLVFLPLKTNLVCIWLCAACFC